MTIGAKTNKQAIIWRIVGVENPPPELVMMINTNNLELSYTPLINETRTRGGFVQEFWGEQLTTLAASGQTAMFYDQKGITNENAKKTEAYQNFIRLVNIYKNNAKQYANVTTKNEKANPNRIAAWGNIVMTYMTKQYEGTFENFSIKESAERPFLLEYDFNFKILNTIGDFTVQGGRFIRNTTDV